MTTIFEHPKSCAELADFLQQNAKTEKRSIQAVGGGTWLDYGSPASPDVAIHTDQLIQVLDYPARDMTITVEAGLPVERFEELLREQRQQVPVDFSQADRATVGGVIAANAFGPRRYGMGTLRDYLIGLTAVDAAGRTFHAGGRVVKNVAGYDLCKMMVGSWGTLAVLTEVTLKVMPIPEMQSWVWSAWETADRLDAALEALLTSETRPIAVEVLGPTAGRSVMDSLDQDWPVSAYGLAVLVAGSEADTAWQTTKLVEELAAHQPVGSQIVSGTLAGELLKSLTNFPITGSPLSFRAHLLSSRTMEFLERVGQAGFVAASHAGNGIVSAHASEELSSAEDAIEKLQPLREFAESQQGSLVVLDCPTDWKSIGNVFGTMRSDWGLMRNLKQSLDPENLLSPGRLFASDR